jgi:hypothetical protein
MADQNAQSNGGIVLGGAEDTKLVFSGPPQALAGRIPIQNTTADKQKIRSIAVSGEALRGPAQLPLNEISFAARLAPGEQANVPGSIRLDPYTPPGAYDFEVTLGSKTLPATAFVNEVVDLRVQPDAITILAGNSYTYKRQFIAQNQGNTTLALGARCEAPIFDSFDLVSSMLIGLRKASTSNDSKAMVTSMLQEWAGLQAGTLVVTRDPIILGPGQSITGEATFELPRELKPLREYHVSVQLYNAIIFIKIYTSATFGADQKPKTDDKTPPKAADTPPPASSDTPAKGSDAKKRS